MFLEERAFKPGVSEIGSLTYLSKGEGLYITSINAMMPTKGIVKGAEQGFSVEIPFP